MPGEIAAKAFRDAVRARELLEDTDDPVMRRILWFGALGILRTVGDALERDENKGIRSNYQKRVLHWKNHSELTRENFWYDFIRSERNNLVHEYRQGHVDEGEVFLVSALDQQIELENMLDVYWPMENGPWQGTDARDVLSEAINWLQSQLAEIGVSL